MATNEPEHEHEHEHEHRDEEEAVAYDDEDTGAQIAPIVRLEEVAVTTGEEDEDAVLDLKSKLYRFDKDANQWLERGAVIVKLLKHKDTGKIRLVMRQSKTLKICANHFVKPGMAIQEHGRNEKSCVWHARDFIDGEHKDEIFCIRFASIENCKVFMQKFNEAAAMINFSHLKASLDQAKRERRFSPPETLFQRFLDCFECVLSGVSFQWGDIFEEPLSSKLLDFSYIPEPVYTEVVDWIKRLLPDHLLDAFILWSFGHIVDSVYGVRWKEWKDGEKHIQKSDVTIFVALAMVLRSKPHLLTKIFSSLRKKQFWYKDAHSIVTSPITVWMIAQASEHNFHVGVYTWAQILLTLDGGSNTHSRDLILQLVDKILAKSDTGTKLVRDPIWNRKPMIPPPSLEILLRLTFPAASAREEATMRFEKIYLLLKKEALDGAPKAVIPQIFTVSLRLAGEGNPVLAKEATAIAIWSLTENNVCWNHWYNLCKENLEASVDLLKTLVEKCSLELSSSPSKAKNQFIQEIFVISLRLAGEGYPVLAEDATAIPIWSLTENNIVCWKRWDYICKENLEASVALLKTLVLAKDAAAIAIWSLTQNVDCWNRWDYLYKENLEASVTLLKKLVDEWKAHSLKLSCDTLRVSQTMKSFMLKNKKAITEGGAYSSLYKEADKSCKVISWRLSRGSRCRKGTCITAVALVTAVAAVFNLRESVWF